MQFPRREATAFSTLVRRLAAALAALVLVCVGPAFGEIDLAAAPDWARVLLLVGGLLLVYLVWLALLPCREALWTVTWVFAIAASGGVLTLAVVLFSPRDRALPLGLGSDRVVAIAWCGVCATLLCAASVMAGRLASTRR